METRFGLRNGLLYPGTVGVGRRDCLGSRFRYVQQGNWATFTPYEAGNTTVTLFAGQTLEAGTVQFSAVADGNVTISITLNSGWRFLNDPENLKIQDYDSAPSGNPSPGLFEWKFEADSGTFSVTVPTNTYYGIHADLEHQVST